MLSTLLMFGILSVSMILPAAAEGSHPFTEKKWVLRISDAASAKQGLVMSAADNLLKYSGPEKLAIDMVAFGQSMQLLLADREIQCRVDSLSRNGVTFSACENTLAHMAKQLGKEPMLKSLVARVPAGVATIHRVFEGDTLIKP